MAQRAADKGKQMKMYEAVTFVPARAQYKRESKFTPVFRALSLIAEGKFLPVECRSSNEAAHLKQECTRRGLAAERRKKTVFIAGVATKPFSMVEEAHEMASVATG